MVESDATIKGGPGELRIGKVPGILFVPDNPASAIRKLRSKTISAKDNLLPSNREQEGWIEGRVIAIDNSVRCCINKMIATIGGSHLSYPSEGVRFCGAHVANGGWITIAT